ncbi:GNAT family N-acetyltransferase [Thermomonospora cellulosilytica]|uniref:GNAT superfamily N-acetyltransferase n=1 Tax=Thermomonospora cellulosilytica TaxID=1411118 RepID=A0A7W3MTJ4_9ACTN|nr:GNAT family N-acetyltransferase [Thermomonospora cellulosilytica]MBA9001578.1 GNAT superfamily N-acetyltransferase [Thermomonospora cellulosilytica]
MLRWDWLSPVVTVPYVPTLGPVHPDALSAELFQAVLDVAGTGRFLPYDKDRRWSATKDEHVLVPEVIHQPDLTVIPTLTARGGGLLKIHYYGEVRPPLDQAAEWARKWSTTYGTRPTARLIWFQSTPDGARTRVMLKTFTSRDEREHSSVVPLTQCPAADTFGTFAAQLDEGGFAFLHQRMKAGHDDGPVLVAVEDQRIVGAIGPLSTMTDATGRRHQPPQYFAVHPAHRGQGHGRALWQAAMTWALRNGAAYKILQAATGSPAERLYQSEGLTTLGFTCARDITL